MRARSITSLSLGIISGSVVLIGLGVHRFLYDPTLGLITALAAIFWIGATYFLGLGNKMLGVGLSLALSFYSGATGLGILSIIWAAAAVAIGAAHFHPKQSNAP